MKNYARGSFFTPSTMQNNPIHSTAALTKELQEWRYKLSHPMKLYPIFNLAFYLICSWMITESAHATTITPSDLLPGDLIFFMDANDTQADHVALFSGIKKDGQPYVIHAVTQPHHAIVNTLLKAQEFTSYFVVRNHNLSLSLAALHRMKIWADIMVPYDAEAATLAIAIEDSKPFCHPQTGIEKHYEFALEMGQLDFYRRIKYAARRTRPTLPADEFVKSRGRGLRCAEAAILAFQIEEIAHIVADLSGNYAEKIWVSDKYAHPTLVEKLGGSPAYLQYQARLSDSFTHFFQGHPILYKNKPKSADHAEYYPSFIAWNKEVYGSIEDYQKRMDTSLPIDSKVSTARVLHYHVTHDPSHWKNLGSLELPRHEIDPFARIAWRAELTQRRANATQATREAAELHRTRAATADLESKLNTEAWTHEVETVLRAMTPKGHEPTAERVSNIFGTPSRRLRFRSSSRVSPDLVDRFGRFSFQSPEESENIVGSEPHLSSDEVFPNLDSTLIPSAHLLESENTNDSAELFQPAEAGDSKDKIE